MEKTRSAFAFLPEQASEYAARVDSLYLFLTVVSVLFTLLAAVLVIVFVVRYRRRSEADQPAPPHADSTLEILSGGFLFVLLMIMFGWGAKLYFEQNRPPADCMEILVTGKQWMWKVQHPQGKKEIDNLHIPVGQNIKITMTSEDVIHDFFIPAFRVKNDAVPGRYTSIWFKPNKIGTYRLFCAEYCGTEHSYMGGWVYVMSQADYEKWVRGASATQETPAQAGARLFTKFACITCHAGLPGQLGPNLAGVPGSKVKLKGGAEVVADDSYLRESIMDSQAKVVDGFNPVMPVFKGQVTEEQVMQLVAYIKTLGASGGAGTK
jgi:cytochrome c oxidase subunit II